MMIINSLSGQTGMLLLSSPNRVIHDIRSILKSRKKWRRHGLNSTTNIVRKKPLDNARGELYTIQLNSVDCIQIDCWNTSQVFKVGHRIGLEISSSAFPKYDRNLNTGAPLGTDN